MCAVGSLAAVVKVTTFFPFLLASLAVVGYQAWRPSGPLAGSRWARRMLWLLACGGIPAVALSTWTHAADHAKAKSVLGGHLGSQRPQQEMELRNDKPASEGRNISSTRITRRPAVGGWVPIAFGALGLIIARRRLREVFACVFLYCITVCVFINLYYIHNYYYFANNIF